MLRTFVWLTLDARAAGAGRRDVRTSTHAGPREPLGSRWHYSALGQPVSGAFGAQ
jgi:hypothetical protein